MQSSRYFFAVSIFLSTLALRAHSFATDPRSIARRARGTPLGIIQDGIIYDEPVFRPPAEWRSLILQVTIGCSWNKCTFCEMYQTKTYRAKPLDQIEEEIKAFAREGGNVRDVFLADGDAMTLPTKHLLTLLDRIHTHLPQVRRVSSYCLPRNLMYKSVEDLSALKEAGLSLVYVGCESGNDEVLSRVNKGETFESSLNALTELKQAGIKRSVMILLGLGGLERSTQHALSSAELCTASSPEFLSVLTTSFPRGMRRIEEGFGGDFQPLTAREGLKELKILLENINLPNNKTIFRSDHASNYLVLKGRLGRDKATMLEQLTAILDSPEAEDIYNLRPEWARGL
jgi:wyosine [tRNA(Phe)-imidazoG37] synthetase (radical SAM superfamily)